MVENALHVFGTETFSCGVADVELLAHSNRAETLYMAIDGKVFDITQFIAKHPGGNIICRLNTMKIMLHLRFWIQDMK